ncbi:class I SAM-dependent methyltransferase [Candidatus Binatia bacterium]|nr:class I SAM-dependent methyltransferase [Candidatus Binatia bacterium]
MALPSMPPELASADVPTRDLTRERSDCLACGGSGGRILLTAGDVAAEQRWLERFHAARRAPARDGDADGDDAKDRASFTQSETCSVVACVACGTVLRVPRPSPDEVAETYAEDEYGRETLDALAENQDAFFAAKLDALAPQLSALGRGARVLEIGSFVGGFLRAAGERGWRALGVDVGEETARYVRARGFDVRCGDVLELDLEPGFAAVFIWSTFDQLGAPAAVLDRVRALLAPGGLLVLRVPNGRFETACLALRQRAPSTRRLHRVLCAQAYDNFVSFPYLTGYTPESLSDLLEAHGFACTHVRGDTILRLADAQTRPFAVREEERVKRVVRRACRAAERATGLLFDPWLDVIARSA